MPKLVNGEHQVKRGERRNGNTDEPNPFPLVQAPGTEVGQQPVAENRRAIEDPASRDEDNRAEPDHQDHG